MEISRKKRFLIHYLYIMLTSTTMLNLHNYAEPPQLHNHAEPPEPNMSEAMMPISVDALHYRTLHCY